MLDRYAPKPSEITDMDTAKLIIPEGTQTGTEFRLRGAGLDRIDSSGKGDQVVRVRLKVPRNLSHEQKEQLLRFAEL
jgi:molecular chaperone DnaJ